MKITDISCRLFSARFSGGKPLGAAVVRVETDTGLAGYGESLVGLFYAPLVAELVTYYRPLLRGRDASEREALWQLMFDSSVWFGRAGAAPSVIGALELALWDIEGQACGQPCYRLWSRQPRESLPIYASLGSAPADLEALAQLVGELCSQSFRALKLGLQFRTPDRKYWCPRGSELTSRLRDVLQVVRAAAGPDFKLVVDGHMGGTPNPIGREEALAVARVLEDFNVDFFEEPLSYLDPGDWAWLRQRTRVPLGGGESLSLRHGFRAFVEAGALDVLQPDLNYVGGRREAEAVLQLARDQGLQVVPHSWCGGPGVMANLHFAIAHPEIPMLEWSRQYTDVQLAALSVPPVLEGGVLRPPREPGLGIADPPREQNLEYIPGTAERASGLLDHLG